MDAVKPLVVQSDGTLLLEVASDGSQEMRDKLVLFSELRKSPDYIHTYKITPLSTWNALSSGLGVDFVLETLHACSKYEVPGKLEKKILEWADRFGRLSLVREGDDLVLDGSAEILTELRGHKTIAEHIAGDAASGALVVKAESRGLLKQALVKLGYPVSDLAGYDKGNRLDIAFRSQTGRGKTFTLRPYQARAISRFYDRGAASGGSGVIVLPCGSGKTIVGMGAIERFRSETLILTTNNTAVSQWRSELLDKTTIPPESIGAYTGEEKNIAPVTISTYQMLTHRSRRTDRFEHLDLFGASNWGLIIYDEVHLLPAPVFRLVAGIQAKRRLGLTATLVREDGREDDVFSLIGPIRYYVPWKVLEREGFIATALCREIRVDLDPAAAMEYENADRKRQFRLASENEEKISILKGLLEKHGAGKVLIIGQFLRQLHEIRKEISAPLITGETPQREREVLYGKFRNGSLSTLIVSKVGNFALDLPDANVLIQVSGTFGSRQEEAQRLGRILRPKPNGEPAIFYTLVTSTSRDQDFAANRQLYLAEQGYSYEIIEERGGDAHARRA
jgi:DNA excision repair protein ERCC-3